MPRSSMQDHSEHVFETKKDLDLVKQQALLDSSTLESLKHTKSNAIHAKGVEKKMQFAIGQEQVMKSVKTRKELHDAIEQSRRTTVYHEQKLAHEMAEANRIDHLNYIKEKQKELQ